MNKILFLAAAGILCGSYVRQAEAADERYVRKQPEMKTGFFVPSDVTKPAAEKLPPFYPEPAPKTEVHQATILEVTTSDPEAETSTPAAEKTAPENTKPKELPELLNENAALNHSDGPGYKQEYASYQRDLAVIAQTGEAPHNPGLDQDLAKMNSEERIQVNPDGTLRSSSTQRINPMAYAAAPEAEGNNIKVLDAVEVVRDNPFEVSAEEETSEVSEQGENKAVNPFEEKESQEAAPALDPQTAAYFQGMNPFREDEIKPGAEPEPLATRSAEDDKPAEKNDEPEIRREESTPSLSLRRHSRSLQSNVIR